MKMPRAIKILVASITTALTVLNVSKKMKEQILDIKTYANISKTINADDKLNEEICAKTIATDDGDFIIAYHSTKRARKDEHDRNKDLERIIKHVNSTAKSKLTGSLRKSYVKISKDCKITIDQKKLEATTQFDGFFGLRTNLENANPLEFLGTYRGLWQVEQTFRIAKTNLEIRPVFHYSPRRIKAHFLICYMALALVRYTEFTLKNSGQHIPYEQFHQMLDRMRKVQIIDTKNELFEMLEDPPTEMVSAYRALKIKWPKRFSNQPNW